MKLNRSAMNSISVIYYYKYELDFATNYKFTTCGLCVNAKTGRILKRVYKSGSKCYNINGNFYTLNRLRPRLVKSESGNLPF